MTNERLTADEWQEMSRLEQSVESLYDWLEKCVSEADGDLKRIIQQKIRELYKKLIRLAPEQ